ncbi:terminase [Rhizobium sp. Leaf371]|uniref:terminase large subunit n=1 Tax=Rhizobium sp. Leaf371 TaxID=1736355 RepID=UPI00071472DB|nr:terminase TerL endonuclease subunit [Rhizobium sp. Leaf371]KQS64512.1 terminase [Rhizobium sp. Leaf371]
MVKLILKKKIAPKPATSYPAWVFDDSPIADPFGYGERAVKFLRALNHPKNPLPGHPFQLDKWQERIVRAIYGPRNPDGTRIVKTVVLLLPRGSRKTSLAAALALLHTWGPERTPGGEVLSAASTREQAKIAFEEAVSIIRAVPKVNAIAQIADHKHRVKNKTHGSFYVCVSNDGASAHGHTPVFALIDEIHAWKKRDLWDAIRSGMAKTPGSLMVIATTAGRGQENLAFEQIAYARKVAKGEILDPATLPVMFETPQDADWEDEAVWQRANPGLSYGYPDLEGLRQMAKEAKERPGDRDAFRQFHLNCWLDHSEAPFVEMPIYDLGAAPVDLDRLKGEPCWIGVDLSSNKDLTAVVAAWRDGDGGYIVHPWYFCPKENLRRRSELDGVPYTTWAELALITPTPGNVVDYEYVEERIRDLCREYDVREIAFDPWNAQRTLSKFVDEGLPAIEMRQGFKTMNAACRELERAILGRKFQHGGHPILRWNFDNVSVVTDAAENIKMDKEKSRERIDGAVATAMAVSRAATGEDTRSIYDTDERAEGLLIF